MPAAIHKLSDRDSGMLAHAYANMKPFAPVNMKTLKFLKLLLLCY